MESGESARPKLRGKSLNTLNSGISKLRGSLLRSQENANTPTTSDAPSFLLGTSLIQRDTGGKFIVMGMHETKHGTVVNLRGTDGLKRVTLNKVDLEAKLKMENGPWRLK